MTAKQIQRGLEKLGNKLDFIPGMEALTGVAQFFVNISLGYIDDWCFGWRLYNPQQGAFQSAADAVVIYAQNWKVLLKGAAKTMLKVVLGIVGIVLAIFIPIGIVFKIFKWSAFIAFILACLLAWIVKFAFIDSYIMCQMMVTYMEVAPTTQITFDLYGQLSGISSSFRDLANKAKEEKLYAQIGRCAAETYGLDTFTDYADELRLVQSNMIAAQEKVDALEREQKAAEEAARAEEEARRAAIEPYICPNCGYENSEGMKFCNECGTKLGSQKTFCTSCGAELQNRARFCGECGARQG